MPLQQYDVLRLKLMVADYPISCLFLGLINE